jgi:hypothetical protein
MTLREAIRAIYAQVDAPQWAALNLDALADVLRDLSWLPEGTVQLQVPDVEGEDYYRLSLVLLQVIDETAEGLRPVLLVS